MMHTAGVGAYALIRHFEWCAQRRPDGLFEAYPDPGTGGAPWTIGWGSTGDDVRAGTVWTQPECDTRMMHDAQAVALRLSKVLGGAATTQHQFDALVDFAYNLGPAALIGSTLMHKHMTGDHAGAAAEFGKWTHAAGRVLPGLVKRRAAEAALYLTPEDHAPPALA